MVEVLVRRTFGEGGGGILCLVNPVIYIYIYITTTRREKWNVYYTLGAQGNGWVWVTKVVAKSQAFCFFDGFYWSCYDNNLLRNLNNKGGNNNKKQRWKQQQSRKRKRTRLTTRTRRKRLVMNQMRWWKFW